MSFARRRFRPELDLTTRQIKSLERDSWDDFCDCCGKYTHRPSKRKHYCRPRWVTTPQSWKRNKKKRQWVHPSW